MSVFEEIFGREPVFPISFTHPLIHRLKIHPIYGRVIENLIPNELFLDEVSDKDIIHIPLYKRRSNLFDPKEDIYQKVDNFDQNLKILKMVAPYARGIITGTMGVELYLCNENPEPILDFVEHTSNIILEAGGKPCFGTTDDMVVRDCYRWNNILKDKMQEIDALQIIFCGFTLCPDAFYDYDFDNGHFERDRKIIIRSMEKSGDFPKMKKYVSESNMMSGLQFQDGLASGNDIILKDFGFKEGVINPHYFAGYYRSGANLVKALNKTPTIALPTKEHRIWPTFQKTYRFEIAKIQEKMHEEKDATFYRFAGGRGDWFMLTSMVKSLNTERNFILLDEPSHNAALLDYFLQFNTRFVDALLLPKDILIKRLQFQDLRIQKHILNIVNDFPNYNDITTSAFIAKNLDGVFSKFDKNDFNITKIGNVPDKYVCIQSASSSHRNKTHDWHGFEKHADIVNRITGLPIVLIGSHLDSRNLPNHLSSNIINLIGQTNLLEAMNIVAGAEFVIGVDSWPAILASGLGIPTLDLIENRTSTSPVTNAYLETTQAHIHDFNEINEDLLAKIIHEHNITI